MQVARGSVGDSDLFLPNPDNEILPPSLDPVLPQDSTWGGGGGEVISSWRPMVGPKII